MLDTTSKSKDCKSKLYTCNDTKFNEIATQTNPDGKCTRKQLTHRDSNNCSSTSHFDSKFSGEAESYLDSELSGGVMGGAETYLNSKLSGGPWELNLTLTASCLVGYG